LRPLRRRAARTARPPREAIRARKPWVFARLRTFGWYVRFNVPPRCAAFGAKPHKYMRAPALCQFHTTSSCNRSPDRAVQSCHADLTARSLDSSSHEPPDARKPLQNLWILWKKQRAPLWNLWITAMRSLSLNAPLAIIAKPSKDSRRPLAALIFAFRRRICAAYRYMPRSLSCAHDERIEVRRHPFPVGRSFHRSRAFATSFHSQPVGHGNKRPPSAAWLWKGSLQLVKCGETMWKILWTSTKSPCHTRGTRNSTTKGRR